MTLLPLALALGVHPALAYSRGEVSAGASVTPGSVPVRTSARFVGEMCNDGTTNVAGTSFLGTYIPTGVTYRLVSAPTRGVCRAVLTGAYTYLYCTVSLRPGTCGSVNVDVTPTVAGDTTLYVLADSANQIRETNELDNQASVVLTAY